MNFVLVPFSSSLRRLSVSESVRVFITIFSWRFHFIPLSCPKFSDPPINNHTLGIALDLMVAFIFLSRFDFILPFFFLFSPTFNAGSYVLDLLYFVSLFTCTYSVIHRTS